MKNLISTILLKCMAALAAGVIGYFLVSWWVFNDIGGIFSVSVLKSQIIGSQKANDVTDQLEAILGISVDQSKLFQLDDPSATTSYKVNVLNAKIEKVEPKVVEKEGWYVRDKKNNVFYFNAKENVKTRVYEIDKTSIIYLIDE